MSTLHRLKAYFGMVPADELDDYGRYAGHAHTGDDEEYTDYATHPRQSDEDYDAGYRPRNGVRQNRWADQDHGRDYEDYYEDEPEVPARRTAQRRSWATETTVRGSLAVDPAREARPVAAPAEEAHPLSRITTL